MLPTPIEGYGRQGSGCGLCGLNLLRRLDGKEPNMLDGRDGRWSRIEELGANHQPTLVHVINARSWLRAAVLTADGRDDLNITVHSAACMSISTIRLVQPIH